MPVAGEHGPGVRRELLQAALVAAHVPELHVAVLGDGGERVVLVRAELDVADRFRVADGKLNLSAVVFSLTFLVSCYFLSKT